MVGREKALYSERCSGLGTAYLLAHLYILFHCGRRGYCWGRGSVLAPLDSITTVLITVLSVVGVGTQRRQQTCQKLTAKGRRVPLSDTLCQHLSDPLVRSCQMPCARVSMESPHFVESAHSILLQWLHFPQSNSFLICRYSKSSRTQHCYQWQNGIILMIKGP